MTYHELQLTFLEVRKHYLEVKVMPPGHFTSRSKNLVVRMLLESCFANDSEERIERVIRQNRALVGEMATVRHLQQAQYMVATLAEMAYAAEEAAI